MDRYVPVWIADHLCIVEILSERAVALHLDPEGRLEPDDDDGAAIVFVPARA